MKLDITQKILSDQAKNLMKQGKVAAYMRTLVALHNLSIQKKALQNLPQPY